MKPVGIVAPENDIVAVRDRLVDILADEGSVAVIERSSPNQLSMEEAVTTYRLGDDGSWTASGQDLELRSALESLAPDHAFVIVVGFEEAALAHLVVGDIDFAGDPLFTAESPDAIDPEAVLTALAEAESIETLESLVARVKADPVADQAGAIATFTGRVRKLETPSDTPTDHLEFEKYETAAADRMARIREDLEARDGVLRVAMHHRAGVVEAGEDIVFVVVLAGHRAEAFRAVEDGINRLKDEVPIFKKEVTVEDTFWVHNRP